MAKEKKPEKDPRLVQAEKAFAEYSDFFVADAVYSDEQAIELIGRGFGEAKWADKGFLNYIAAAQTPFEISREYVPVFRSAARVQYTYADKDAAEKKKELIEGESEETEKQKKKLPEKTAEKNVEEMLSSVPEQLDAKNFAVSLRRAGESELDGIMTLARTEYVFGVKNCERALMSQAAKLSPDKKAKIKFVEERYDVVFVPVLVATCVYDDRKYISRINLDNGKCAVSYPISGKLSEGVDKHMRTVATSKLCCFFAFLYTLTLGVLALVGKIRKVSEVKTPMLVILFGLTVVPLLSMARLGSYKRDKMIRGAKEKGEIPKVGAAKLWAVLSWLVAVGAAVLFAVYGF